MNTIRFVIHDMNRDTRRNATEQTVRAYLTPDQFDRLVAGARIAQWQSSNSIMHRGFVFEAIRN